MYASVTRTHTNQQRERFSYRVIKQQNGLRNGSSKYDLSDFLPTSIIDQLHFLGRETEVTTPLDFLILIMTG